MNNSRKNPIHILPSFLDRLTNAVPEDPERRLDEYKQNLKRDLENFLNTRTYLRPVPGDDQTSLTSILDYGLNDFSSLDIDRPESRELLRMEIERKLLTFFTCFERVHVEMSERKDQSLGLHFDLKINALLRIQSLAEPILFMASMQPNTRSIEVKEAHYD